MSHVEILRSIEAAYAAGNILDTTAANLKSLLREGAPELYFESVAELIRNKQWAELNDRFFRTLAFGTGGLRGRTIGRVVTKAEQGAPADLDRPQHPCVGSNAMNTFNIVRATRGLVEYLREWLAARGETRRPVLVIAHDVRHFSREFAALTARVASENGCDAVLFAGPRSTPELSFAVRHLDAQAGIVITASHNPPHDNGYKVYFRDGAQIVEPHAGEIIKRVNAISSESYEPLPEGRQGSVRELSDEIDKAYMDRLETLVLDRAMVAAQRSLKIVFSPIHGTGGVISLPTLDRLGFDVAPVEVQNSFDGRFPTVKSPNPENAEALTLAIEQANLTRADLVMATDPDGDRLGVAVRARNGEMTLLSGNQIASLIAHYRLTRLREQNIITAANASRCVIVKTVVTTDLLAAIAAKHGIRCVETLTGFKYIGGKLTKYELALPEAARAGYVRQSERETRDARLAHSCYYVFGGEESYGYSGADFVRDKDGNGSAIMFAETAAYAASRGLTLVELLDEIFATYGFYLEKNGSLAFDGAEGAAKIAKLSSSYSAKPPTTVDGSPVLAVKDFDREDIVDADGDVLPKEKMIQVWLEDGRRIAIRPSGTEPKIKFYMFAKKAPPADRAFTSEEIAELKIVTLKQLDALWVWIQADVVDRLAT